MTKTEKYKILYLVHDLYDPAVYKRVAMLKQGGAEVTIAGFRRVAEPIYNIAGCYTLNLGQTYNGGFVQRLFSVIREIIYLTKYYNSSFSYRLGFGISVDSDLKTNWYNNQYNIFKNNDLIIARNLEMLAIGVRSRNLCKKKPILVYESLDIHRLLLNKGIVGKALRKLEGWLTKRASALITSSPAFIREYFDKLSEVKLPIRLVENKVYNPEIEDNTVLVTDHIPSQPWKIGWFGAIRCRKSLDILTQLVKNSNGNVEIIIRGRPSLDQFDDFYQATSSVSGLKFLGEYKNPDDLSSIYGEVHFTWAVDMFEEGLNSSWLLPNRLYEGCLYGSVPIAVANVETGHFISNLGIGVTIKEPKIEFLTDFFKLLTEKNYCAMRESLLKTPRTKWIHDSKDCHDLVMYLKSLNNVGDI